MLNLVVDMALEAGSVHARGMWPRSNHRSCAHVDLPVAPIPPRETLIFNHYFATHIHGEYR